MASNGRMGVSNKMEDSERKSSWHVLSQHFHGVTEESLMKSQPG
jgi:hypothetical protein